MFSEQQKPDSPYTLPLKVLAGSAALFLLSLGFCGVGAFSGRSHFESFFIGAGLLCLSLSGLTFISSIVWLLIAAIASGRRNPPPATL